MNLIVKHYSDNCHILFITGFNLVSIIVEVTLCNIYEYNFTDMNDEDVNVSTIVNVGLTSFFF